ncbi:MAG: hypothetical protein K6U09_02270 [Acidobacteriia bacterium]|nr:hypothetical protein [Terriglobia bacterium]
MNQPSQFEFTVDELVLALVSLIRVVDPTLLQHGPDGVTLELEPLMRKPNLTPAELLLLKLRSAFDEDSPQSSCTVTLSVEEAQQLEASLAQIEALHNWPPDVRRLSAALRARLMASG